MLTLLQANQPNAVEEYFCKPFEKLVPTTDNLSKEDKLVFFQLANMPNAASAQEEEKLKNVKSWLFINKILQTVFTVKLDYRSKLWLMHMAGEHQKLIMAYVTYVQYKANQLNQENIDFITLCEKIFPEGNPDLKEVAKLFNDTFVYDINRPDDQGCSLLSTPFLSSFKSIQFEKEKEEIELPEMKKEKTSWPKSSVNLMSAFINANKPNQ